MESYRLGVRKPARQRAETREGRGRPVLVVEPDGRGSQRLGVVRGCLNRREKLALRGDRTQDLLVGRAPQQVRLDDRRDAREARHEGGQARRGAGMPEILRADGRRRIRLDPLRSLPGARRVGLLPGERESKPELELGDRVTFDSTISCGACFFCDRQLFSQCPQYKRVGVTAGFEANGGGLLACRWTSLRVASVTPTTVPAAARAASPTTIQTRPRALISGDASSRAQSYISYSDADVSRAPAADPVRDLGDRREPGP